MVDVGDENLRCNHHSPYDHPLSITENFLFSYFLPQKMLPLQLILPDLFFFFLPGVLAQVVWYPMLWCDATQSTVSRVLVWSRLIFQIERFPAPQKNRFGPIPARFVPIPAWVFFQQIFRFCPMCVVFAMHTGSCRRLYQPQLTPFDPNCNTCLCCQRVLKLPKIQDSALRLLFCPKHCLGSLNSCWNGEQKSWIF